MGRESGERSLFLYADRRRFLGNAKNVDTEVIFDTIKVKIRNQKLCL